MPTTHTLIQTVTVGSGGISSIDFTSIPQTYTDLSLRLSVRQSGTGGSGNVWDNFTMSFNNLGTNKASRDLHALDNTVQNNNYASEFYFWGNIDGSTAGTFTNTEIYIPNYTGALNKAYSAESVTEHNASALWIMFLQAGLWSNTAAINRITFYTTGGTRTFMQHSSASLYGISNS